MGIDEARDGDTVSESVWLSRKRVGHWVQDLEGLTDRDAGLRGDWKEYVVVLVLLSELSGSFR